MKGRTVPENGKGERGTNEWEEVPHENGTQASHGRFERTKTTWKHQAYGNREQRRRAIARKRKGL